MYYQGEKKVYSYENYGEMWDYNPSTDSWTSSTGQTYKPSATTGAPIGHEDEESYKTESGETWSYDDSSGTWKSSSGQEYTPPPSSYYSYDASIGGYVDTQGNVHEVSQVQTSTSQSWSYDTSSGTWKSSSGESYNPYTGTTTDASGQATSTYDTGGYYSSGSYATNAGSYTDPYGSTWERSSDGSWTSSTGQTYTPPSTSGTESS